jgi:signal transduction histidine kinase
MNSLTILIVDDYGANRKPLRAQLEAEGHRVLEAGDGLEALQVLEREPVAAVISDLFLPNMDGFQLCRELRRSEKFNALPFIHYTSTYTSEEEQKLSESVGADQFLIKPISPRTLLAALAEAIRISEARQSIRQTGDNTAIVTKRYGEALFRKMEDKNTELATFCAELEQANKRIVDLNADLERRIQARTAEIQAANRELAGRNQEIQNFYHTLAHELKTPLTSAREFVSILMEGLAGPLNPTQLEYLGIARESCDRLRLCIDDLYDSTRLETGKLRLELKPASLGAVAQQATASIRPLADAKGISLSCEAESGLPKAPVDENRITQIITNLLINALKFTPSGGKVRVRVTTNPAAPAFLRVSVSDTGCGIARDQWDRIFDRLYQVKMGDGASAQGFGLGLYLCRELVKLHGGKIQVESEPGQGSIFSFTVPLQTPELRIRVLIVDDDPQIRDFTRRVLEKAGFQVTTATGGIEALELMRQQARDIVLLDLEMPDLDGAATLKQIRQQWGLLPVIIQTGYPEGELMFRALEFSPFTLLSKPCSIERLVATVRGLAQPSETSLRRE